MSIVAPISATNALIPFAVGIAAGERPAAMQLAGVVLAAIGVILVAVEPARHGETVGAAALPGEPAVEPEAAQALFRRTAARSGAGDGDPGGRRGPLRRPTPRPSRAPSAARSLSLLAAVCMGLVLVGYDATARYDPLLGDARRAHLVGGHLRRRLPGAAATREGGALGGALHRRRRPPRHRRQRPLRAGDDRGLPEPGRVLGAVYPVVTVLLAYGLLRENTSRHTSWRARSATLAGIALIAAG